MRWNDQQGQVLEWFIVRWCLLWVLPCRGFHSGTKLIALFSLDRRSCLNNLHPSLVQTSQHIRALVSHFVMWCAACPQGCLGKMSFKGSLDHWALCQPAIKKFRILHFRLWVWQAHTRQLRRKYALLATLWKLSRLRGEKGVIKVIVKAWDVQ